MSEINVADGPNLLLRTMSADDRALLEPHFIRVSLDRGELLVGANQPIEQVWFPEGGIASTVATMPNGVRTEVGIFGRDGMSGLAVVSGSDRTPLETFIQVDGSTALRMDVDPFRSAVAGSPTLRNHFLRFGQSFMVQTAYSAVANAHHMIEARLARWLLMCHDRIDGDEIQITHEFMSMMIAAQRSGVTLTLHVLEGAGMIRSRRGRVVIVDRAKLRDLAGDAYGAPEAEYTRLVAPLGK